MKTQTIVIRDETKADASAITEVAAAEVDGRIAGHIAFSPVIISQGTMNGFC